MKNFNDFEFDDLQGLIRFGYGKLTDTSFLLLNVVDSKAAKEWLKKAPVSNAVELDKAPETALQLAFTVQGLRTLGLRETAIESFSDEFITGISGDESRSRRLGDIDANSPEHWAWGGKAEQTPHLLLLLYALPGAIENWQKKVMGKSFSKAFQILSTLPTLDIGPIEPFGFAAGISQPVIDWDSIQSTDLHDRSGFSNFMAVGEVVLGYPNEYQQYNARPLMDPKKDKTAEVLANAEDKPDLKDFGRNGSYLVLRQLSQDVPGFWKFVDRAAGSIPEKREQLAAAMVGRNRDGKPLVSEIAEYIPGIPIEDRLNHFNYDEDAGGNQCPIGAHVRRTNPRKGDMPPGDNTLISRVKRLLGFGLTRPDQDLVASSRFHRLLRRGRTYGPILTPEEALKPELPDAERGLQFICLVANIMRQFEFVQNAWVINSKFSGVQQERDASATFNKR